MSSPLRRTALAGEVCAPTAIHRLKTPASGADPTHSESASAMAQLSFCEARKGVMFEFPMRRPHPLTANLLGRTEARRAPASSHPATRDAAKTYVLQELLTSPWRRAFFGQIAPGGRVDLEENDESTTP